MSGGAVKKRKYKDSAAQTSPAFVRAASEAAKRAKKARLATTSDDSPSPAKRKKNSASSGTLS